MITVSGVQLTFRVPDPRRQLAGVRLRQDIRMPPEVIEFRRSGDWWQLVIPRPPVRRLEYLLELRYDNGSSEWVIDPDNPMRVDGAFGMKSVLEFPGYQPPSWLSAPAEPGTSRTFGLPAGALGAEISVRTWCPAGASDDEPLPLLVVHDGPEYDSLARITGYLSAGVTGNWLPRLRAALLSPGLRDAWYSANAGYARALRRSVIPALTSRVATTARIGMGTSLGALAMLHAHCRYPEAFDALFLQSGSFFCPSLDSQERRFPFYRRIVRFVAAAHSGSLRVRTIPVVLTCGQIEENVANNRLMTEVLRAEGYQANLHEVPDMHNYTAWRDAFDPHLTRLLAAVSR
jgi:enterochelin esterase-like enzyme